MAEMSTTKKTTLKTKGAFGKPNISGNIAKMIGTDPRRPIQETKVISRTEKPVSLSSTQYRSGIYFVEPADEPVIKQALEELQQQYTQPIVVECQALENFYPAEEYHQRYLAKNPRGYCHIDLSLLDTPL